MDFDEYIKESIDDMKDDIKNIEDTLVTIQVDIARIQTETRIKTAMFGLLGGLIPAAIIWFMKYN